MNDIMERMVPISSSQSFPFQCRQCGACCRHVRESVPLESLDLYRLAKYLKGKGEASSVDEVLDKYAEPVLLDECGYMMYVLKTTGEEASCIFLKENHCSIHRAKPRACRTYPIEINPGEKEKYEQFLALDYRHHFNGPRRSVAKWLGRYFIKEDQEFVDCDAGAALELARLLRQVPQKELARAINLFIYYKYTAMELERPFMEQFKENTKKLIAALEKIVKKEK